MGGVLVRLGHGGGGGGYFAKQGNKPWGFFWGVGLVGGRGLHVFVIHFALSQRSFVGRRFGVSYSLLLMCLVCNCPD